MSKENSTSEHPQTHSATGLRGGMEEAAASYMAHVVEGKSIRSIAQGLKVHPSTVMRRIRKVEGMRDDPVLDQYLNQTVKMGKKTKLKAGDDARTNNTRMNDAEKKLMRRLCESGATLVVSKGLKKAMVMRTNVDGKQTRTAVVDSELAGSCVIRDWIRCVRTGRVSVYEATDAGAAALKRVIAQETVKKGAPHGFSEAPTAFSEQHKEWGERVVPDEDGRRKKVRVNLGESPLTMLARKKDKNGKAFLNSDLIEAGDRLREDFELAQIGPRVGQNWDRFLTGGQRGNFSRSSGGSSDAQLRLDAALAALGQGLSDIVLRCCCFLEGLEAAEKRMGWSARSGKIVLRIALQRLRLHYDTDAADDGRRIG